ncbi:MAG: type II secretion system major pseudopilin GspG [Planctomycetes bacterium]|nr:type II secretion system major pseudopilin GspG [Planctomycetota bacterium]
MIRRNRRKASRWNSGFTLMELMIVLVIIGVLAAAVAPVLVNRAEKARTVRAKADLKQIADQCQLFKMDQARYPDSLEDLSTQPSYAKNWPAGGYFDKALKDPWGADYVFQKPGDNGKEFDVITYGADNQQGGEGTDADIHYWTMDDDTSKK